MSKLTISNGKESFEIEGKTIIDLEIKLNATEFGKPWINIGDYLYNFYNLKGCKEQPPNMLNVKDFQYNYLKELNSKNYEQVIKEEFNTKPE